MKKIICIIGILFISLGSSAALLLQMYKKQKQARDSIYNAKYNELCEKIYYDSVTCSYDSLKIHKGKLEELTARRAKILREQVGKYDSLCREEAKNAKPVDILAGLKEVFLEQQRKLWSGFDSLYNVKLDLPEQKGAVSVAYRKNEQSSEIYIGEWDDGMPNGYGQYFRNEQKYKYTGYFKEGQYDGEGQIEYSNGSVYVGEFKKNQRHGNGSLKSKDGTEYEGTWKDDHLVDAYISYNNGDRFIGSTQDFYPKSGTMLYSNNIQYVGTWRNGQIYDGNTYYSESGKFIAEYKKGQKVEEPVRVTVTTTTTKKSSNSGSSYSEPNYNNYQFNYYNPFAGYNTYGDPYLGDMNQVFNNLMQQTIMQTNMQMNERQQTMQQIMEISTKQTEEQNLNQYYQFIEYYKKADGSNYTYDEFKQIQGQAYQEVQKNGGFSTYSQTCQSCIKDPGVCPVCHGSKKQMSLVTKEYTEKCKHCGGTGICPACNGSTVITSDGHGHIR